MSPRTPTQHTRGGGTFQRVTFVVLLLVVVGTAGSVVTFAAASQQATDATRTVENTTVDPGDSIDVEIVVTIGSSGEALTIDDLFEPAFSDVEAAVGGGDFAYNGEATAPDLSMVDADGVVVGFRPDGGFEAGDTVTLSYTATVPENETSAGAIAFDGEAAVDDHEPVGIAGPDQVSIRDVGGGPLGGGLLGGGLLDGVLFVGVALLVVAGLVLVVVVGAVVWARSR